MRLSPLCICIALWLCCAALPATVAGAESYLFSERWSFDEKEKGYLEWPAGIVGDDQGRVYVVDRDLAAIRFYSPSGEYLGRWGAPGTGILLFTDPIDISIDDAGRLYAVDTGNKRIQVFTEGCDVIATWSGINYKKPVDVAVVRKGKVYVADVEQPEVLIVDDAGIVTGTVGSEGTGDGGLRRPRALALDSGGNLYVLDESLSRVTKFGRDGGFLLRFDGQGSDAGKLNHPEGLVIDALDNIYVADSENGRVVKFDPEGEVLATFGARGSGDGLFEEGPYAVWVDPQGTVYVPDVTQHGIQIFRPGPEIAETPAGNTTASSGENSTIPIGTNTTGLSNGTALNSTGLSNMTDVNGTATVNRTAVATRTPPPTTPLPAITAVNITPYGTPTPLRSLPAPLAGLFGALAIAGLLVRRRRR